MFFLGRNFLSGLLCTLKRWLKRLKNLNNEVVCCFVCEAVGAVVVSKATVVMTTNWTHATPDDVTVTMTTASAVNGGGGSALWRSALILCVFVFIIVGTVLGNSLVCTAVGIVRCLRTPSNLLIVSLAVSDLLVASLVMSLAAFYEVQTTLCADMRYNSIQ